MLDLAALPTIPCKWRKARTVPLRAITIHTAETTLKPGAARAVATYLANIDRAAGIHYCVDASEIIRSADESTETVPHCYQPSRWSIGIELATRAYQADWADDSHRDLLANTVELVAALCRAHQIPAVRLLPAGIPNGHGIFGHADATAAYQVAGGHADPGPSFPWAEFIDAVDLALNPPKTPEVKPMYAPALTLEPIVADAPCPAGGAWLLAGSGAVYAFGGAPYLGAPNGQPYWGERTAATIEPWQGGYVVTSTSGETYHYGPTA